MNAMNEKFSRPKGRLFAALFRLRVQCIFFPTGEYTYSTLAKRRGEGGKGEDAAGILRRSRRKTVREAAFRLPYVRICAALFFLAARAYEKIRTEYFRQKKPYSVKILQIICLRIRYNQEEERE